MKSSNAGKRLVGGMRVRLRRSLPPSFMAASETEILFAIVILCTSDPRTLDAKTRSKWARALKSRSSLSPVRKISRLKSKGGINEISLRAYVDIGGSGHNADATECAIQSAA